MRDYDANLKAQHGADLDGEDTELDEATVFEDEDMDYDEGWYYCDDTWCAGHALPSGRCEP